MNYKSISISDSLQVSQIKYFEQDALALRAPLMSSILNPQWYHIISSPFFKEYNLSNSSNDLLSTDFPFFVVHLFQEFSKKRNNKTHYFSSCFSRNEDENQLYTLCEAAALITATTTKQLPQILLIDEFIKELMFIAKTYKHRSPLMALQTLSNIAENSFQSSAALISNNFFDFITDLILTTNVPEIQFQATFSLSSLAKFDHGDIMSNNLYNFFVNSQHFYKLFDISLRAFSFLVCHHPIFFNQQIFIENLANSIKVDQNLINSQCISILILLCQHNPQIIGILSNMDFLNKIFEILTNGFSAYCIQFLHVVLLMTREYDDIIFCDNNLNIILPIFYLEKNDNKYKIAHLFSVALNASSVNVLLNIVESNIIFDLIEVISQPDASLSASIIVGMTRMFSFLDQSLTGAFVDDFVDSLNAFQGSSDGELCLLAQNSLKMFETPSSL